MDPFIGQIIMFGGNFAPRGWALCDGQLLSISQNSALFSILGTTYGGDGRTTFGLPDLRGRVAMHNGNGPGLADRRLGQKGGQQNSQLAIANMPSHNHQVVPAISEDAADQSSAENNFPAETAEGAYHENATGGVGGGAFNTSSQGGGQAFSNETPYQVVNFIIALVGTFPSRN